MKRKTFEQTFVGDSRVNLEVGTVKTRVEGLEQVVEVES